MMDGCQMSLYVAPRYRSSYFIFLVNLSDALGPRSKYIAFQVSTLALEVSLVFGLRAWFIFRFLASVLLGLGGFPTFTVSWDIDSLYSCGRDGFDLTIPPHLLNISCSYVEFKFCVCRNSYGLVNTEIFIKSLLSSLLDRQEQEKWQTG